MRRHLIIFSVIGALVFAADRLTKWIVEQEMVLHQDIPVIGDWARLTFIHNSGAAFGLFQGSRMPLVAISVLACVGVTWLAVRRARTMAQVLPLGLILGGALGNLLDRMATGLVIDFINLGIGSHRWPVFNVADSAVTVGVLWLALGITKKDAPEEGIEGSPESSENPA